MTRQELLAVAKPILFNTEMVGAILDNRKMVTRRVVKPQPTECLTCGRNWRKLLAAAAAPYRVGDYLYVRETWCSFFSTYLYKANGGGAGGGKWRPSIHMPREAARLFLRVTDVRVEQLQDITEEQAKTEGADYHIPVQSESGKSAWKLVSSRGKFISLWDSTIKKSDLPLYGWDANPWVWVVEFERVDIS